MKRLLTTLALLLLPVSLHAAANDLILSQRKADNSGNIERRVTPTEASILGFSATLLPVEIEVSTGLSLTSNALTVVYGTTAGTAAEGDDSRLSDARTPTGDAGGVLDGTYPNPSFAVDMATQEELDDALGDLDFLEANEAITGGTHTKITFDAKGLVTAGEDATTADIDDSEDRRYVTDAQLVVIGSTSGTNTGDQTSVSGNAGTATALQTARTINGVSFDGTANITVPAAAGTLTGTTLASGVTASSLTSAAGGTFGTAAFTNTNAYEVPLTFSTGLTRTTNTITVNTTQNIAKLSNLTSNGLVKTSGSDGTLGIASAGTDYLAVPGSSAEGDILFRNSSAWTRLPRGTDGQVLTATSSTIAWDDATGGFTNPMTTAEDLIVGGTDGAPERLGVGSEGAVLKVVSGVVTWGTDSTGGGSLPADPVEGDIIYFDGTDWVRQAIGTAGQVLVVNGTADAPEWAAAPATGAPTDATYITQTSNGTLSNEQALSALSTGIVKVTTSTGVLSTAAAGTDYVAPGAATSSGLTMATARLLGRTTASSGAIEEITVGTGLTLADGELTATGGGGGSGTLTLARFTATDNQPPASNYATFDTRNAIAVLDFDDTTAESAVFVGIVPEAADFTSGIAVRIHWTASSATSGDVIWTSAFERANTDLDSDNFATGIDSAAATANGTSGIATVTTINHSGSEIDGLTAGDLFRMRLTRKAADGADTMTGDAEVIAVELRQR
jgi:hypothetical protein